MNIWKFLKALKFSLLILREHRTKMVREVDHNLLPSLLQLTHLLHKMELIQLLSQLHGLNELLLESWLLAGFAKLSSNPTASLSLPENPLLSKDFPLLSKILLVAWPSPKILLDWECLEQILEILNVLTLQCLTSDPGPVKRYEEGFP